MPACLHSNPKDVGQYRMTQEEQRMVTSLVYQLSPIMKLMGKQTRQEFLKISEVLQAFKQGLVTEGEVIYEFINLEIGSIKSKDKLMELVSMDENALKINAWWTVLRSWAKVPALNSFILSKNQEDTDKLQEAALAAWQALEQAEASKEQTNRKEWLAKRLQETRLKGTVIDMQELTDEEAMEYFDALAAYQAKQKDKQALKLADKEETEASKQIFTFDML